MCQVVYLIGCKMENYLLEYIIDRKTNTKFEEMDKLSSKLFYDFSLDFIDRLKDNESNRILTINLINEKLRVEYISNYYDINKKFKKNKSIDINKLGLNNSAELKELIKCYNFYISEKQFLKESYQALFKEHVQIMNDEFRKSEKFETLNSLLPLISTNLENDLNNFLIHRRNDKKTRQFYETMLKIFVRGVTKTTPFSLYASTALIKNNHVVEHKENILKVEINFVILKMVFDTILKNKLFRKQVSYRVSYFNIGEDSTSIILQNTSLAADRIINNVDTFKTFRNNFFYEKILKHLDKKSFNFLDFFDEIQSICKCSGIELTLEEVESLFDSFVSSGLIVSDLILDESKEDIFEEFYNQLDYFDDKTGILQEIKNIVKKIEKIVQKFSDSDYKKRFYYLKKNEVLFDSNRRYFRY